MKKNLFVFSLFLISFSGFSQTLTTIPVDGFLGIKFGLGRAAVIAAMKAHGATLNKQSRLEDIAFDHVKLGGRNPTMAIVRFTSGKMYEAEFTFTPEDDTHVIDYYNNLVSDLSKKYGPGDETKTFKSPFKEGDGHEIGALMTGDAEYTTVWGDANQNMVIVSITKNDSNDLLVELDYENGVLLEQETKKEDAKTKGDL